MLNIDLLEKLSENDTVKLLQCIGIKTKTFKKNSVILKKNSAIDYLGIILDGKAKIIKTSENFGNTIFEELKTNDIFGHNIVCCGMKKSPVEIITETGCEILFLPFEKVITPCEKLCSCHLQLIKNIMKMISMRNNILNQKTDLLGLKTTREKILAFLKQYDTGEGEFTIPYTRAQSAKFLCVDRSALSRELCKLRDNGVLKFDKNRFEFLKNSELNS